MIKYLILIIFISCANVDYCPDPGDMRCDDNISQMCSADKEWSDYQDCKAINKTCSTACGGYVGLTCCR